MNHHETTDAADRRHLNIEISKFKGMKDLQPRPTTLLDVWPMLTRDEFVRAQTSLHRTMTEAAARHRAAGDGELALKKDELAREAKEMCPAFSPAVVFYGGKGAKHIAHYTGLSMCDFDHVPEGLIDDARDAYPPAPPAPQTKEVLSTNPWTTPTKNLWTTRWITPWITLWITLWITKNR